LHRVSLQQRHVPVGVREGEEDVTFHSQGPISFDDSELVVQTVLKGAGIGMAMEHLVMPLIRDGQLIPVMKDWCPTFSRVLPLPLQPPKSIRCTRRSVRHAAA
jgi:DNA-binding transcriptional LysR family regulator